jgi:hypothetical protein
MSVAESCSRGGVKEKVTDFSLQVSCLKLSLSWFYVVIQRKFWYYTLK